MVHTAPKVFYIPIEGYRHMYRSLMRYFYLDRQDAATLLYPLYMGNIDTCTYYGVQIPEIELSRDAFIPLLNLMLVRITRNCRCADPCSACSTAFSKKQLFRKLVQQPNGLIC